LSVRQTAPGNALARTCSRPCPPAAFPYLCSAPAVNSELELPEMYPDPFPDTKGKRAQDQRRAIGIFVQSNDSKRSRNRADRRRKCRAAQKNCARDEVAPALGRAAGCGKIFPEQLSPSAWF